MKRFLLIVRENKVQRERMEKLITEAHREFVLARAALQREAIEQALMLGMENLTISAELLNIMSVEVTTFEQPPEQNGPPPAPSVRPGRYFRRAGRRVCRSL